MHCVLPYSVCLGCMVFNNLIWDQVWLRLYLWTDFCQWRVVRSCDSLSINSSSLLLHGSTEQSRAEMTNMVHDDRMAWWLLTTVGLAGGILPSWEGVLKLATRAKFHLGTAHLMEMMIALNSSFREDKINLNINKFGQGKVYLWRKSHICTFG